MAPFTSEGFFVMQTYPILLNTQGGPERNIHAEILDQNGQPIPHLYGAGECVNSTAALYNGGANVCECFIMGETAGVNAAAAKDPLPVYTGEVVESTPAHLGDESDYTA